MRKIGLLAIVFFVALFSVGGYASAQSFGISGQLRPSDSVIYNNITMDCPAVKKSLARVHENDGLARVNAGQQYDSIGTKLMARFNAKLAENKLDAKELFSLAAEFDTQLTNFRDSYRTYENAMRQLIKSDCEVYPQNFYYLLETVRAERENLNKTSQKLHEIIAKYRAAVETFASEYRANQQKQGAA